MSTIFYLTFNESYSGVYQSQVVETVKTLEKNSKTKVKIIALISLRNYFRERSILKKSFHTISIYPAYPKVKNWSKNQLLINKILLRKSGIILSRGVFAANLALGCDRNRFQVCYDGRGAISCEAQEYDLYPGFPLKTLHELEQNAVINSDYRIAVSQSLVRWWKEIFNYNSQKHILLPCLATDTSGSSDALEINREALGIPDDAIVLCFNGSNAGWQRSELAQQLVEGFLKEQPKGYLLFLTKPNPLTESLQQKYTTRVTQKWLAPREVPAFLRICDYGLLIREKNCTNRVASPVKFAEYLSAGLPVLISEDLGDYSELVEKYDLGKVINSAENIELHCTSIETKERIQNFAKQHLQRDSPEIRLKYQRLINELLPANVGP